MAGLFMMPSTGKASLLASWKRCLWHAALGLAVAGARDLADGELGTTVSKDDLFDALARLIAMPKPDLDALTRAVRARFVNAKVV